MYKRLRDIPTFPHCNYEVDVPWTSIVRTLEEYAPTGLDLDPPYQRGYLWTEDQKSRYIEYCLKGGKSGKTIYFNDYPSGKLELVDGKQRLSAVLQFLENKVPVFGKVLSEYEDELHWMTNFLQFAFCKLESEKDVVNWYLSMNSGGTYHTEKDIQTAKNYLATL